VSYKHNTHNSWSSTIGVLIIVVLHEWTLNYHIDGCDQNDI